ncbi:MAG: type IV pilus modification protein PilV [Burkholderiaceae bacterium]|jgi:type IV pilus assembly protein PilV|nr:type IV pilus modification protein PilV [Burkholderiaceae bacterium]
MMKSATSPRTGQRGMALIEALVALLILVLGILGLAAMQTRMLVETRTTNARASAVRLIGDLNERIDLYGRALQVKGEQPAAASPYATSDTSFFAVNKTAPSPACPAAGNGCTPTQQAAYDLWAWRTEVARSLMGGRASISQISPRQLQVVVAWQLNENTGTALRNTDDAAARQLDASLQITAANGKGLCADNYICHIDFIDIPFAQ